MDQTIDPISCLHSTTMYSTLRSTTPVHSSTHPLIHLSAHPSVRPSVHRSITSRHITSLRGCASTVSCHDKPSKRLAAAPPARHHEKKQAPSTQSSSPHLHTTHSRPKQRRNSEPIQYSLLLVTYSPRYSRVQYRRLQYAATNPEM